MCVLSDTVPAITQTMYPNGVMPLKMIFPSVPEIEAEWFTIFHGKADRDVHGER